MINKEHYPTFIYFLQAYCEEELHILLQQFAKNESEAARNALRSETEKLLKNDPADVQAFIVRNSFKRPSQKQTTEILDTILNSL